MGGGDQDGTAMLKAMHGASAVKRTRSDQAKAKILDLSLARSLAEVQELAAKATSAMATANGESEAAAHRGA